MNDGMHQDRDCKGTKGERLNHKGSVVSPGCGASYTAKYRIVSNCHRSCINAWSRLVAGVAVYISVIDAGSQINAGCGTHDTWRSTNGYTLQLVWQNGEEEGII